MNKIFKSDAYQWQRTIYHDNKFSFEDFRNGKRYKSQRITL